MSVVIRLMRAGAKKRPFFRMVAADSRRQRDGRFLEILGHYNPMAQPYELVVHKDKVEAWLSRGAQPSEQAAALLRSVGVTMRRPVAAKPASTESTQGTEAAQAMPTKAVKRAQTKSAKRAPRKVSVRKAEKKAAKKAAKKSGTKKVAKKASK